MKHQNGKITHQLGQDTDLRAGPLEILFDGQTVLTDGRPLTLTVREFQLLAALAQRRDLVVGRDELYEAVWHEPMNGQERSVDVYVSKVRSKLELALPHWKYIHTHIGFGYCFSPQPVNQ
jgi:DNA-binding response OmpR family regulator